MKEDDGFMHPLSHPKADDMACKMQEVDSGEAGTSDRGEREPTRWHRAHAHLAATGERPTRFPRLWFWGGMFGMQGALSLISLGSNGDYFLRGVPGSHDGHDSSRRMCTQNQSFSLD